MKVVIPEFSTKKELFKYVVENEGTIIAQKKSMIKEADSFGSMPVLVSKKNVNKSEPTIDELLELDALNVKVAINTTNVVDSHWDLHVPGLWDKSLKENKNILHLQEHKRSFDALISSGDDLKASAKTMTWKDLGFEFEGSTQALIFDSKVRKDVNEAMFKNYAKGVVKQHSVGMQYVKMVTCINDEDYPVQKENWDKYIEQVANKEYAEDLGVFWAVTEAKVIEGSSVLLGSNSFTPTLQTTKLSQEDEDEKLKVLAIEKWLKS